MSTKFKIDNKEFNVKITDFKRSFEIRDGDNAGQTLNGNVVRDVKGTYYAFEMTIGTDNLSLEDYDSLYEIISQPTDYHLFEFPYAQSVISFNGYVQSGSDNIIYNNGSTNVWGELQITVNSMSPQRRPI